MEKLTKHVISSICAGILLGGAFGLLLSYIRDRAGNRSESRKEQLANLELCKRYHFDGILDDEVAHTKSCIIMMPNDGPPGFATYTVPLSQAKDFELEALNQQAIKKEWLSKTRPLVMHDDYQ
jgi:hypothetical protein